MRNGSRASASLSMTREARSDLQGSAGGSGGKDPAPLWKLFSSHVGVKATGWKEFNLLC